MAISGAAASPNMSFYSEPALDFHGWARPTTKATTLIFPMEGTLTWRKRCALGLRADSSTGFRKMALGSTLPPRNDGVAPRSRKGLKFVFENSLVDRNAAGLYAWLLTLKRPYPFIELESRHEPGNNQFAKSSDSLLLLR
jgi:hypothetical protein